VSQRLSRPTLVSVEPASAGGASHPGSTVYLDDLFAEISALPSAARETAVRERCQGDPEVERMLRAMLRAEPSGEPKGRPPARLVSGALLGRYRLEEALGAGATASVWKAWDTHLHTFTALKILNPEAAKGSAALDAVLREARAASAIISDHVVRVKTAGRFEEGPAYVEMELCAEHRPGPDGAEVLEVGRNLAEAELATLRDRVRAVAEAARGVDAAHRVGVLHRDLKPGNILLTPESCRAKVTDFGLAADQVFPYPDEGTPATATVTLLVEAREGRIVGTPAYMSPEQALGHPPTRAADVYGLGATLYALLCGRPPYEPDGRNPIPALDVLAQVRAGPPAPLRTKVEVPPRLERIVERAMARSARRRYRTAGELARDLEAFLADRPTSVDGRAPILQLVLFARRQRVLVATVALLAFVVVAFGGAVGFLEWRRRTLTADIERAERRLVLATAAAQQAEALRDRTEQEKQQALREAEIATAERERALQSESSAERRWLEESTARQLAQDAQKAAETSRTQAERTRDEALATAKAAEDERGVALVQRDRAVEEAAASVRAMDEALAAMRIEEQARLEAEAARADAEEELRRLRVELVEAELAAEELRKRLESTSPSPAAVAP
jgi:serine/threonine protein kinase